MTTQARERIPVELPAGRIRVGDQFDVGGIRYQVSMVIPSEVTALRLDDTGSVVLRIHDDTFMQVYL